MAKSGNRKKVPAPVELLEWRLKTAVETVPVFVPKMAKTSTEKGLRDFTGMAKASTEKWCFYRNVESVNREEAFLPEWQKHQQTKSVFT